MICETLIIDFYRSRAWRFLTHRGLLNLSLSKLAVTDPSTEAGYTLAC